MSAIPGYDFGASATAPISLEALRQVEETAGWTADDEAILLRHGGLFRENAEAMVDSWRAVIGGQAHLAHWFTRPDGAPDDEYKAKVRRRFVQWVIDVATRPHDRDWLNYQFEIGLRHTPAGKNKTDGAHTPPVVPFRYLMGFIPVVLPIAGFFADAIGDESELARLQQAWTKAVLLHITLWSRAYMSEELW